MALSDSISTQPEQLYQASSAQWRLHRLLVWRIAGTALALAGLLAALVYMLEQRHTRDLAVDLAVQRVAEFTAAAGTLLAAPDSTRNGEIQMRLDEFARARAPPREGGIVAARLLAVDGTQIADIASPAHAQNDAVKAFLDTRTVTAAAGAGASGNIIDIDAVRHVFVQLPMRSADSRPIGSMLAVFAPSDAYLSELQRRIWRTVAAAVAVVLISAAVLYPVILRLVRRVTQLSADLIVANLEMLKVLGGAIAKRDADTDAHNYRVTIYSVRLAERIGLDANGMQALIKGSFLHDVGKIGVPDHILLKPGKLDETEFAEMKRHVDYGLDIVQRAGWLADAEAVVGYHHRRFDGGGYGGNPRVTEIPMNARIFAIADVFDALTSKRPYKEPFSLEVALEVMGQSRGAQFDPQLFDAFSEIAGPLHAAFANRDDGTPQQALRAIVMRYFRHDLDRLI
jgi:HD-GYP domain-containing protein (c-di-GMP phosphodiesterase class II)